MRPSTRRYSLATRAGIELPLHDATGLMLRQLVRADCPQVIQECYVDRPEWERLGSLHHALLAASRNQCLPLTIERHSQLVGAVQLFRLPEAAEIANLAVSPACRRAGIATRALQLIINAMPIFGRHRLVLRVSENNIPALGLYLKIGFQVQSAEQVHQAAEPILSMVWEAGSS